MRFPSGPETIGKPAGEQPHRDDCRRSGARAAGCNGYNSWAQGVVDPAGEGKRKVERLSPRAGQAGRTAFRVLNFFEFGDVAVLRCAGSVPDLVNPIPSLFLPLNGRRPAK